MIYLIVGLFAAVGLIVAAALHVMAEAISDPHHLNYEHSPDSYEKSRDEISGPRC